MAVTVEITINFWDKYGINKPKRSEKQDSDHTKKKQTAVEKLISETKKKVHNAQNAKK